MEKVLREKYMQKMIRIMNFRHLMRNEIIAAVTLLVLSIALLAKPQVLLSQAPRPPAEENAAKAEVHYERGKEHFDKKDYDLAITELSEAIRLDPYRADAYNQRGRVHIIKGDAYDAKGDTSNAYDEYNSAIADFSQAIKLNPKYDEAYDNRALVYDKQGNKARATGDALKALDLGLESEIEKEFAYWTERRRQEREKEEAERAYWIKGFTEWMVPVVGGTFTMGCTSEQGESCNSNELPAHQVAVSDFLIGKYTVTNAQWALVMASNYPSEGGASAPATEVSWDDVQIFISRLNALTKRNYRLPTEAEWEYAARGGNKSQGYKYSGGNNPDELMNKANELGIYYMSWSVVEWVYDYYEEYSSSPQLNPKGPSSGDRHVVRGGSANFGEGRGRVSSRIVPGERGWGIGFRLAHSRNTTQRKTD